MRPMEVLWGWAFSYERGTPLIVGQVALGRTKDLEALHERVAKRWFDVCCVNAGPRPGAELRANI